MAETAVFLKKQNKRLQVVKNFKDLLGGKSYAMLGDQVVLYEKENGEYVVFTIDPSATYSKDDYLQLPEGAPFELINGKLINMAFPKTLHQLVLANLFNLMYFFVKQQKTGVVFTAPMDVHFDQNNIVQPDILFVSNDKKNIIQDWIYGVPDVVVEVISPSTKQKDKGSKFKLYQKHGVAEYWLLDLDSKQIELYVLDNKKYELKGKFKQGDKIGSSIMKGFEVSVGDIFETTA